MFLGVVFFIYSVKQDAAGHRGIEAIECIAHGDGDMVIAGFMGQAAQAFFFGANHQRQGAFQVCLCNGLWCIFHRANDPDAGLFELFECLAQIGDPHDGHEVGGTCRGFFNRGCDHAVIVFWQHHPVDPKGVGTSEAGAEVVWIL